MNLNIRMRKLSLTLAAGAAAVGLFSCSEDVVVQTQPKSDIYFRAGLVGSRAAEITTANLQNFKAIGFSKAESGAETPYYSGGFATYTGEKLGSTTIFTGEPTYYWPEEKDAPIKFYAYGPASLNLSFPSGDPAARTLDFTCTRNLAEQADFIVANAEGTKARDGKEGVLLTFDHMQSQVIVMAKNENPNYTCEITGVRIGRIKSKATYKYPTPGSDAVTDPWDNLNTTDTYTWYIPAVTLNEKEQSLMNGMKTAGGKEISGNPMILPQKTKRWNRNCIKYDDSNWVDPGKGKDNYGAYLAVKIKITSAGDTNPIELFPKGYSNAWAAVPLGMSDEWNLPVGFTFEPGKIYTFVLDFTYGAGNVAPSVPVDYPDPDDPDNPDDPDKPGNPDDPTLPDGDPDKPVYPGDDPEDPDNPGNPDAGEIILGRIKIDATVEPWNKELPPIKISMVTDEEEEPEEPEEEDDEDIY